MRFPAWTCGLLGAAALSLPLAAGAADYTDDIQVQHSQTGISYITGGIGDSEQAAIERRADDYSLRLVNTRDQAKAAYVANVKVRIRNQAGKQVLDATTGGPWLLADLPPGNYSLTAEFQDESHTREFTVPESGQQRLVLRWQTAGAAKHEPSGDTSLKETVYVHKRQSDGGSGDTQESGRPDEANGQSPAR